MAELEREMAGIPKVISLMSSILERVSESNDQKRRTRELDDTKIVSGFYGLSRPSISIKSYLERIFKYANCSPSCFVVAYVYLHRFLHNQPSFSIDSFNVHRLLITSVLLSAKFLDDLYYNNAYYAKVGGISTMEMNLLELDFLFGLRFQLNVSPNTFHIYCSYLQSEMLLTTQPKLQIHHSFTDEETSLKKQFDCLTSF
ncbi:cyclin-U4-1-like [Benincasa hispida]|uniref:cyclin-U4-1-like n=1 Tax=Benincasa hispida TaxID=102211 RepID=UPI0019004E50|nr:cyclin-U4-1-like [Benincasa hispida]